MQKVGAMIMAIAAYKGAPTGIQQLSLSFSHMHLEDAMTEWSETDSHLIRIATIWIPMQMFDTLERRRFDKIWVVLKRKGYPKVSSSMEFMDLLLYKNI